MKQYCNLNPRSLHTLPAAGSADELSPAINPVWRIILFPSSGQTLSVIKWPRVPPGSPIPSRASDSARSQGWGGCSVTSTPLNLCPAPVTLSPPCRPAAPSSPCSLCSGCNFISCRSTLLQSSISLFSLKA